jgi:hypothetical protein
MSNNQTMATLATLVNFALMNMDADLEDTLAANEGITDPIEQNELLSLLSNDRLPLTLNDQSSDNSMAGYVGINNDSITIGILGKNGVTSPLETNCAVMIEHYDKTLCTRVYGDSRNGNPTHFIKSFQAAS